MAQLSIARKDYDDATRHLANDVCILSFKTTEMKDLLSLDL